MGKKSGGSQPAPPDPAATAAAQAGLNKEAILESARVNQMKRVTPWGTLTYSGEIGTPGRTETTTLTPEAQNIYNQQLSLASMLTGYGGQLAPQVANRIMTPPDLAGRLGERQRIEEGLMARLDPYLARTEEARRTQLANQGITQGSEAWRAAQDDLARARNDAMLATIGQAGGEYARDVGLESALRAQAINELSALTQGAPAIGTPQFGQPAQYQIAPGDYQGAANTAYGGQLNAYNQQLQARNAAMGGLFGLGGAVAGALPWASWLSDRRLKKNIRRIGALDSGIPVYLFEYILGPRRVHMGVMADEVERVKPEAVLTLKEGHQMVDYARL